MSHRSDEDLFRAFQQQRDCDALGILFRRRAQELVRLAVFVAPSPSDAEDLVQATFLTAITRAETFRDDGLVMSWMSGILSNHARMLHRAASRRVPAREAFDVGGEPVAVALQAELRSALATCIASLPEPYHSVLTLHLHNGLDSQEISQRLGRPAATVRKQMERAIDRLRQVLPIGLATGVVLRLSPDVMAQNAANAARYGEIMSAASEPMAPEVVRLQCQGRRALLFAGLALALAVIGLTAWSQWPAALVAPVDAAGVVMLRVGGERLDEPIHVNPGTVAAASLERERAASMPTLSVTAHSSDGAAQPGVELLLVPFTERSLVERMAFLESKHAATDGTGLATFSLDPGWYQVVVPGAATQSVVQVAAGGGQARVLVTPPLRLRGTVVDERGAPVAGAEVIASANAGGSGLGTVLGRTGNDGAFAGTARFVGKLWARHVDYGPSIGVRMEAERNLRLVLARSQRLVTVTTVDGAGLPLAGCCIGLVPRSDINEPLLPQHGVSDAAGRCTFADPGVGEATVVASRGDRAASLVDLAPDAQEVMVTLHVGGDVVGIARAADGTPLVGREVVASVPSLRTNEPAGNLVGRVALTDSAGAFTFTQLPVGQAHLRMHAPMVAPGLLYSRPLVASGAVEVRAGERTSFDMQARPRVGLTGRVVSGQHGMVGWLVVATPDVGIAQHRLSRARCALTGGDGEFVVEGVNAGDAYQVGAFPPEAIGQRAMPHAVTRVEPGVTAVGSLVVDAQSPPRARLRCRITDSVGRPLPGALLELRPQMFQIASTKTTAADGSCEFDGLLPGDYWLARSIPGSGSRTIAVTVPTAGDIVDLGDQAFAAPAFLTVVVHGAPNKVVRVVARHDIGDRYIEAMADARGVATLPAMTPGPIRLLMHGPGFAPESRSLTLVSGPQDLQVEVVPAAALLVSFDYAPAENPLTIDGPLHVQLFDDQERLVFEDYVGRAVEKGSFKFVTGLPTGDYRLHARSIWNASAKASFHVAVSGVTRVTAELRL